MSQPHPRARIEIDAALETVWAVMTDLPRYGEWNSFLFRADCAEEPRAGAPIRLHVRWTNGRTSTSPERISRIDPPATRDGVRTARLEYVYEGLPARLGLVRGTRIQELSQEPGGPTVYDTVELFTGPLVRLAGPSRVAEGFHRHATDLKARAEQESRTDR